MALYKNNKQDGSTILIAGTGGIGSIEADSAFDSTSINPVQNKVITEKFSIIDNILYKQAHSILGPSSDITLTLDTDLKLYDKIILSPRDNSTKNAIINYKYGNSDTLSFTKNDAPTILVNDNISSIKIDSNVKIIIYRCIDGNDIKKINNSIKNINKEISNNQTELIQKGIFVPNLTHTLDFSLGDISEDGDEISSLKSIKAKIEVNNTTNTLLKSSFDSIVKIAKMDEDGNFTFQTYTLNESNNYTQTYLFKLNYTYFVIWSYASEEDIQNIDDMISKIGIYVPKVSIVNGAIPISNGDGTWSWKNPENEIQKMQLFWNGLTIDFYKQGRIAWMKISGTLSADLAINNAFVDMIIPLESFKPTVSDTMDIISGLYRFQINAVKGTGFRIGQGKILSTETGTDITAGTELHFNRMYIC